MEILITLLVIAAIAYIAFWIIGQVGLPNPIDIIVKAIVAIALVLALMSRTGISLG